MSLLLFDGFEYGSYEEMVNGSGNNWFASVAGPASTFGRFGTGGLITYQDSGAGLKVPIANKPTVIAGCALYHLNTVGQFGDFFALRDSAGHNHITLSRNSANSKIDVFCNTTLLGTLDYVLPLTTWIYVEVKATIHSSAGSVEVRINQETKLSLTNINTSAGGAGVINQVVLGARPGVESFRKYHDDFYICDNNGALNNDFLGDVKVVRLKPNAAGDNTQFTPLSGANYTNVDEAFADGDSSYVSSDTAGNKDLYNVESLASTPASIYGVRATSTLRKNDAGALTARNVLKSGTTTANGSAVSPLTTYAAFWEHYETDPNTSTAWTNSAISSLQVGIERVS